MMLPKFWEHHVHNHHFFKKGKTGFDLLVFGMWVGVFFRCCWWWWIFLLIQQNSFDRELENAGVHGHRMRLVCFSLISWVTWAHDGNRVYISPFLSKPPQAKQVDIFRGTFLFLEIRH